MRHLLRALSGCLIASLCLSVLAVENSKAKRGTPNDYSRATKVVITDELRKELLQFMLLRNRLLTPPQTCVYQPDGVCAIEVPVVLLTDPAPGGQQYCVAVFPAEVHLPGTASTNLEKTIVWKLTGPSPAPTGPATFTFYGEPNHGIIVLTDSNNQMHGGALGDGTATTPDPMNYHIKDRHKKIGDAVYIPIVVRTDNPGTSLQKISVCGTPDPRIVNE